MKWVERRKKKTTSLLSNEFEGEQRTQVNNTFSVPFIVDSLNLLDLAIWSKDLSDNKVTFVSEAIQDIYGIPAKDVKPDTWKEVIHPEDLDDAITKQNELHFKDKIVHTYRILTPGGVLKWVKDHTIAIKDEKGKWLRLIGSLEDITHSKTLQQKIRDLAYVDEHTQLPNRNAARKYIKEAIAKASRFALYFINMDNFTRINDAFGLEIGDLVIRTMVERLSSQLGDKGKLFRMASDEFLVVGLWNSNSKDEEQLAQHLLDTVNTKMPVNDHDLHLTASIGISYYPSDGKDMTTLSKNGRAALKRAKDIGKGLYQTYSSSMSIESYRFFQLEGDLKQALDQGELYFEYQPKVDAKTQKAIGAEALIRWKHPNWGDVSPMEFISIAEEGYLIHQISDFVIDSVCRQASEWEKKKVPFQFISFNMSPKNFLVRDLVERIQFYLNQHNVNPDRLELEITEDVMLQTNDIVEEQMQKLKNIGMRIAIDDYGTGYSSVVYLKRYPVDTIKIDRSFIGSIPENSDDLVFVKSFIDLAKGLGKNIVAEGVETREQYDLLKKMGCEVIQGFLFSPPVSPEKMERLFSLEKLQQKKGSGKPKVERRRNFRLELPFPLSTEMTIVSMNNQSLSLGTTEVVVENIGPGGLRLMSHLRLTPHEHILFRFETEIMGERIDLNGKIVWNQEVSKGLFNYGVEFTIDENDRDDLTAILNKVAAKIRANVMLIEGNFVAESATAYLRKQFR